jgi:hypothetical protein
LLLLRDLRRFERPPREARIGRDDAMREQPRAPETASWCSSSASWEVV